MAEAFVNHCARESGNDFVAESAGTVGGKVLNQFAIAAMSELGISMEGQAPKLLTQEMADRADSVISMGCGVDVEACPATFLLAEDWELDDPAGKDIESVRIIRDQIRERVEELMSRVP